MDRVQDKINQMIFAVIVENCFQNDAANQASYDISKIDDFDDDSELLAGMLIW